MIKFDSLKINQEILSSLCNIERFAGAWNALGHYTESLKVIDDVAGHGRAMEKLVEKLQTQSLSEDHIFKLYALFSGDKSPAYRTKDECDLPIIASDPDMIAPLLNNLLQWTNDSLDSKSGPPLLIAGAFLGVFLQIAPFPTHNIRLGCFLVMLLMMKNGYSYAPYSRLETILKERETALKVMLMAFKESLDNGRPDWETWLAFFLKILEQQKQDLEERLLIFQTKKKLSDLPTLSQKIMRLFKENGQRVQIKEMERSLRTNRSTLKLRLTELVNDGWLIRGGQARSTWYSLP